MNRPAAVSLYLAAWLMFAALLVAGLYYLGLSLWYALPLAYLIFLAVNGTLAYRHRTRQLALEGLPAPSYPRYLLFGEGVKRELAVPRPIRLLLALIIGFGGASFVAIAAIFAISFSPQQLRSPLGAAALLLTLALMGLGFVYVAVRLAMVKDHERLFPLARLRLWHRDNGA